MFAKTSLLAGLAMLALSPLGLWAQEPPPPKGEVIEQIIARVNDDIITSHEYKQALEALKDEIRHDCNGCSTAQIDAKYAKRKQNALRDLIDESLLVQQAKDEGISVDIAVVKRLDEIRQQYHLASMDALRRAVENSGLNWDDYKASIKKHLLTQKLIQQDVGGTIQIGHNEIRKYYEAHKNKFVRPETVVIREIFLSTKGKTPAEAAQIKKKLENIRARIENGDDFGQLAKLYSQGSTAQQGGELGAFTRGQLAKPLEDAVFKLQHNQMTPVIPMAGGFELLQVEQHFKAGLQPMDAVENEIENAIYMEKIGPALRHYLEQLRKESYIVIQPGYIDTAAVTETPIEQVTPGNINKKGKKKKKKDRG